jgi:hypothetical protein
MRDHARRTARRAFTGREAGDSAEKAGERILLV